MHHPLRAHFPQIAVEYGRGSILKWRNAGAVQSANGDETSLVPNGTIRKEGNASKGRLLKELQDVERGIKRCLDFITGGDGDPGSVRDQLRRLEARKRDIDADLTAQQDNVEIVIHPNLPELYRKKVGRLQQALQHETTRPQVVETIRSLVDRIEILPGEARGRCEVTIVGALAQILAFAQKTTAALTGGGGTSLMVAGVGFEPTTFRL
jgi:site-specific DNA recombinase